MNKQVDSWATRQKDDVFFLSWKESRRGRTITRNTLDTVSHDVKSLSLTFGVEDFHGVCCSVILMVEPCVGYSTSDIRSKNEDH
jgi:hypothetical protein